VTATSLPDFLGPFRLARFIQSGNSCQIWEAIKDDGSGRYVLKVLRNDYWGNKEEAAYLKHEFEVANGLTHPNVIRIHEFRTEGKIAYLVLEIFAPLNLKMSLRENPQLVHSRFSKIVPQCAASLEHLHENKWAHCDIKPDNFLMNDDGQIKLIDFTIAKKMSGGIGRLFARKGTIRGTRSYMSPEQIRGKPLDARSDVYSFGCVVYELLANKVPYTGISPDDLLTKHLKAPFPSILVANNNVTNEMNDLVRRMMAKDPISRPASMGDFLKEFRSLRPFKVAPKMPDAEPENQD